MTDRVRMLCPLCGAVYSGEYTGTAIEICLVCALAPLTPAAQIAAPQPTAEPQIALPFDE